MTTAANMKLPADMNPDAPCVACGAPTLRGLNTDFCSLDCENAHYDAHGHGIPPALYAGGFTADITEEV